MKEIREKISGLKNLLLAAAMVGVMALASECQAALQVAGLGGTNNVPAASTNDYSGLSSSVFALTQTTDASIQVSFASATSTNVIPATVTFDASLDNANWMANWLTLSQAANYTNQVTLFTNLPSAWRPPFLRLHFIQNPTVTSTNYLTNITVKVFTKDGI